jgi:hypothetical protein
MKILIFSGVTERRTYHHVPLCIVCDCYSMAYLSVLYQACGFFFVSFRHVFSSVFRDSNKGSSLTSGLNIEKTTRTSCSLIL